MQNRKRSTLLRAIAVAATLLLALVSVATADTPFTATGWPNALLSPGITATNALGQVFIRGNVHTARVQASDARFTGQVLIITDGAYNPDFTANVQGPAYLQIGSWDAAGTNFTPAAGLWIMAWRGVMQPDNSLQLSLAAYGSGGSIDGLRLETTLTRTNAASPVDPTVPYQYSGTIKAAPVNTTQIVNAFDAPFTGDKWGTGAVSTSNGRLNVTGAFPYRTTTLFESYCWGVYSTPTWDVPEGMTREWRVDLVGLDENSSNPIVATLGAGTTSAGGYFIQKSRDFAYLWKWVPGPNVFAVLAGDPTSVRNTNIVLALALTRKSPNLVITARVLDKDDPNTVLYQRTVVDTPNADSTLTVDQFETLTGWRLTSVAPEGVGLPLTQFGVALGIAQYTDGRQPNPTAVFDNLEVRTSEIPSIGIQTAVQLTWPDVGNCAVECAPTVNGPWLPAQNTIPPGCQQMTVPQSGAMQFFRQVQAP